MDFEEILDQALAMLQRRRRVAYRGVPVAGVQKTTLRTFVGNGEEANAGLRPRLLWTETPCIFHV
jgi:hypothetical protein